MSNRQRLILIVVVVAAIIFAAVFLLFGRPKAKPQEAAAPPPAAGVGVPLPPAGALPPTTIVEISPNGAAASAPTPPLEASLVRSAASFAERYGSYSNQGNFENLRDLFPLMTEKMRAATERLIAEASKSRDPNAEYFGVTTRAVTTTVANLDEEAGVAAISVAAQRTETRGTSVPTVSYQTVELSLLKIGEEWKFDKAMWK